jgi:suppressor for copper-sensitivity B
MQKYMKLFFNGFRGGLLFLFLFTSILHAQDKDPIGLKLVPGGSEGAHVLAGLVLTIPPEWQVYAPSPQGEDTLGFDPTITWETSSNVKDAKVLWPVANKKKIQDQLAYIYEGKTLIPLQITPEDRKKPITLTLKVSFLACSSLCVPFDKTLSIVLKPGDKGDGVFKAVEQREEAYEGLSLFSLLCIALLGGFILNFMPCVLPVLSLKVMSLVKQSKKNHGNGKHAKQGFFITGLGILASFLILALITVILKASGQAFGWGIHFQNPHFLLFVFLVLVAFAASLCGIFEIDLPSGLGTWLIGHEGKGKIKDFLSGVFATLLATPCSAPFVGTALSFALARNTGDIFLVFFFLGLGFASPYLLIASLPQRYVFLPKPGVWMVWLQTILGVILALTALWIGWILTFHLPLWVVLLSTGLALIALSLFWVKYHYKPQLKAWAIATPLFLMAWALSWVAPTEPDHDSQQKLSTTLEIWQPFEPDAISALVAQGKFVFVDATAEWCVTCAVNKSLVMNDPRITALLSRPNVIAMRADWTRQDPRITAFLQAYGRYGIPFNIIFGPNSPKGIPLPEILSIEGVEDAFKEAGLPIEKKEAPL